MTDKDHKEPAPRALQKRSVETRSRIIHAAAEIFDEKGYAAASISMILERAQLTKGALYHHFNTKEQIAEALLAVQVPMSRIRPQESKWQESIDTSFIYARLLQSHPEARAGVRLSIDGGVPSDLDVYGPTRQWIELATYLMTQVDELGHLSADWTPRSAAELIQSSFVGAQLTSLQITGPLRSDLNERIENMWKALLPGMATMSALKKGLDYDADRWNRIPWEEPPAG
ncbi:TetR/AcrR family transcriptional regulator (plasmid) [Streptomyces sp. NBC_00178]|uniref:ScbR family autoregulator-binding transcription factor n=1 Tax=Streptomyces sp. NBC_00178 TaxID=2975672 RepID=UPI002E2CA005|nr:ScbR family autoregulator-binding transcription factor [Streptomyces sp. NBC_00178]